MAKEIKVGSDGWSFKDWYANGFYNKKEEANFKAEERSKEIPRVYQLWKYSQIFDITEVNSFSYTISIIDENEIKNSKALWWYRKHAMLMREFERNKAKENPFFMFDNIFFRTRGWAASTPKDFIFSAKVPGMITHAKCLEGTKEEADRFLKAIRPIRDKMKYLLYEFPNYFTKTGHFDVFKGYFSKVTDDYKYVVEFRNIDWQDDEVYDFLKKKKITLAMSEVNDKRVQPLRENKQTTNETYIRIIGKHNVFKSFGRLQRTESTDNDLVAWAETVKRAKGKVMVLISNNFAGNAPETANMFMEEYLGMKSRQWRREGDTSLSKFF